MKKIFFIIFSIFLLCSNKVYADEFQLHSKHAILYNLDNNTILYEKASDEKTSVASLTKIMTAIVAIENIEDLNQKVTLKSDVFTGLREANASVAGFRTGDKVTYLDLLMGTLLPSGADAARGLAINISGSEKEFVKLMNKKAKDLGLKNTNFVNITGLDVDGHYSTVKDVATILQYALKNDTFKMIYTTKEYKTTNGITLYTTLRKHSSKIKADTSNILGTKTGFTYAAGLCLSSIANYNGINYLLVTTGANHNTNSPLQLIDALTIYNYYSNNFNNYNIINVEDEIINIPIKYSVQNYYSIKSPKTISKYLPNSFNKEKIKYNYEGLTSLSYKNNYSEEIGKINIIYEDQILDTIPVYLNENISFSVINFLIQTNLIYVILTFIFVLIIFSTIKILRKKSQKISP